MKIQKIMRKVALSFDEALQIFNLPYGSSQEEIKKKFRELALKMHPDRVSPEKRQEAEEMYKWISNAYEILNETQEPGRPENPWFLKKPSNTNFPKDQIKNWASIQLLLKKWIIEMAKKYKGSPVKRPNNDRWYAIRLSDWVGIGVFFEEVAPSTILPDFSLISLGQEKSWKIVFGPKSSVKPLNPVTLEIPQEWQSKLESLYELWKIDHNSYERMAGKKNVVQNQKKRGRPPKKAPPPPNNNPNPNSLIDDLERERAYPDAKDLDRVRVIYSKRNPISEAQTQAKKITDKSKALRRAKAALRIPYVYGGKEVKGVQNAVAIIFYKRYLDL